MAVLGQQQDPHKHHMKQHSERQDRRSWSSVPRYAESWHHFTRGKQLGSNLAGIGIGWTSRELLSPSLELRGHRQHEPSRSKEKNSQKL